MVRESRKTRAVPVTELNEPANGHMPATGPEAGSTPGIEATIPAPGSAPQPGSSKRSRGGVRIVAPGEPIRPLDTRRLSRGTVVHIIGAEWLRGIVRGFLESDRVFVEFSLGYPPTSIGPNGVKVVIYDGIVPRRNLDFSPNQAHE